MDMVTARTAMVIVVDFDGTLTLNDSYPGIGELNVPMIQLMIDLQDRGDTVILSTARENDILWAALDALREHGFILDFVNNNADHRITKYNNDCRKVCGDVVIDDKSIGYTGDVDEYRRVLLCLAV